MNRREFGRLVGGGVPVAALAEAAVSAHAARAPAGKAAARALLQRME